MVKLVCLKSSFLEAGIAVEASLCNWKSSENILMLLKKSSKTERGADGLGVQIKNKGSYYE